MGGGRGTAQGQRKTGQIGFAGNTTAVRKS